MIDKRKFYINGQWVSPSKPNDYEVINPSTEEAFATISLGSTEDTNAAVTAAKEALVSCCLLYTSPSPRDDISSRMPSSA